MVGQGRVDRACPETSALPHMVRVSEQKSIAQLIISTTVLVITFLPFPLDMCMPPSPPTQPVVMAVSDTELALSWQKGESEGSAPVLHFLVAYIRSVIID